MGQPRRYGVVRALWGDVLVKRRDIPAPHAFNGLLKEVRETLKRGDQYDLVCCWGKENLKFCQSLGMKHVLFLGDEPYASPKIHKERGQKYGGMLQWGYNHFWHKWQVILQSFNYFDAVVAVDWDAHQLQPLTIEWWERQEGYGLPFRATLIYQENFTWAAAWRKTQAYLDKGAKYYDSHFMPYCGCLWTNSQPFIERCQYWSQRVPHWMQQQSLAKTLDESNGEAWIGIEAYRKLGYEPNHIEIGQQLLKPKDETVIWKIVKRGRKFVK